MTDPRQPGLDPAQALELRAADGLASGDELAQLRSLGVDPMAFAPVRSLLTQALAPSSAPDLADAVMARIDGAADAAHRALVEDLRAALDGGPAPELADDVLMLLDLADDQPGHALRALLADEDGPRAELADGVLSAAGLQDGAVGPALRALLDGGDAPDLADDVMAALGLAEADAVGAHLRQALAAPAPDLSGGVMAALGLAAAERDGDDDGDEDQDEGGAEVIALPVAPRPAAAPAAVAPRLARPAAANSDTTWRFPAVALAAAAALLLFFTGAPSSVAPDQLAFELAPINHVDIEELSTGDEVMVQVLQMDENAPTIIFIDELSEDDGGIPL
ncbi:hypothetical protein L6R53_17710 [Myxococcota bacterium]|nr:hypothetical protein [Myxococcota bacterium]